MKTFDPYDHFIFLTNRVGRLLANEAKQLCVIQGYDFPPSCMGVLADLWSEDGVNQKDLGMSLIKSKSSINKMLLSLEEQKLIEKVPNNSDKRNKQIKLTPKGKQMQARMELFNQLSEQEFLSEVNPEELAIAKKVLTILYQNLSKKIQTNG